MFVYKEKINKVFFPMLHHGESREKPRYNMSKPRTSTQISQPFFLQTMWGHGSNVRFC